MKTVYLVKSSEILGNGDVHWENLRIFQSRENAEIHCEKVQKLIGANASDDEVIIEEFTLED
jgi:hypothetical protein